MPILACNPTRMLHHQARHANFSTLRLSTKPDKSQVAVLESAPEETYFAPKGSLDRLLHDSRFVALLKTLQKVPRVMEWIKAACYMGCKICTKVYPEQRRISIALCGHAMCDACLQQLMGDKLKSVYCWTCRKEILVVFILDRPKNFSKLDNVKHFLLQDDTPVHDASLKMDSLVSLWRVGKEYPIALRLDSVEPVPTLEPRTKERRVEKLPVPKLSEQDMAYNRQTEALVQSMLSNLAVNEDLFKGDSPIEKDDLIDWDKVFRDSFCEPHETEVESSWPSSYNLRKPHDFRMESNFLTFQGAPEVDRCYGSSPTSSFTTGSSDDGDKSLSSDSSSDVTSSSDSFDEKEPKSPMVCSLISQLQMNYKEKEQSDYEQFTFISEGEVLKRRLECPQWIMRVQVIPVIFDTKPDC